MRHDRTSQIALGHGVGAALQIQQDGSKINLYRFLDFEGGEHLRWKLELKAPNRQSQYSNVRLWVEKGGGALLKLEGYDWSGKLAKRFIVVSAQKIEGRWFLKEMRIEEFDPSTGKARARTYLEIKK